MHTNLYTCIYFKDNMLASVWLFNSGIHALLTLDILQAMLVLKHESLYSLLKQGLLFHCLPILYSWQKIKG